MLWSKTKTLAFTIGPALALSPLAVVIACNKSADPVVVEDNSEFGKYQSSIREVKATPNSTHNQITWGSEPVLASTLTTTYLPAVYSTKTYANAEAALSSPSTDWTSARPTSTDIAFKSRNLWARINLVPAITNDATTTNTNKPVAFDLGVVSGLQGVKVGVSALPAYQGFDLSATALSGSAKNATITNSLSANLAPYLKLQWQVGDSWLDEDAFKTYLQNNETLTTRQFIELLVVRVVSVDEALYFFAPISTSPNTSGFNVYVVNNPTDAKNSVEDFLSAIGALKVQPNSTHINLLWGPTVPGLSSSVTTHEQPEYSKVEFKGGSEAAASDPDAAHWVSALPTETNDVAVNRNLWVRVRGKNGAKSWAIDLTFSSLIRTERVAVQVAAINDYKQWNIQSNITNIGWSGDLINGVKLGQNFPLVPSSIANYVQLEFSLDGTEANVTWLPIEDLNITSKDVAQRAKFATRANLANMRMRVVAKPGAIVSFTTVSAAPKIVDVLTVADLAAKTNLMTSDYVKTIAAPLNVTTYDNTMVWPEFLKDFTYFQVPYFNVALVNGASFSTQAFSSAAEALGDTSTNWSAELPTSLPIELSSRNLWVRFKLANVNYPLELEQAHNLSNLLSAVKVRVEALPVYKSSVTNASQILANVSLSGTPSAPVINSGIPEAVRGYIKSQWLVNNAWLDEANFIVYLQANPTLITRAFVERLLTRSLSVDESRYFIKGKTLYPNVTNFTFYDAPISYTGYGSIDAFGRAVTALRVDALSTHTNLIWGSELPALGQYSIANFNAAEYSTFNFADSATAEADTNNDRWTDTIPTQIDYRINERYLWLRAKHRTDSNASLVRDLTLSSGIRNALVNVYAVEEYKNFDFEGWVSSNIVFNSSSIRPGLYGVFRVYGFSALKDHVILEFQANAALNTPWLTLSTNIYSEFEKNTNWFNGYFALDQMRVRVRNLNPTNTLYFDSSLIPGDNGENGFGSNGQYTANFAKSAHAYAKLLSAPLGEAPSYDALTWNALPEWQSLFPASEVRAVGTDIDTLEFSTNNFATAAEAAADQGTSWTSTLPSSVSAVKGERRLWMRFANKKHPEWAAWNNQAVDLTYLLVYLK